MSAFLSQCALQLAPQVTAPAIESAINLCARVSDGGSLGLAAMLQCLRRPELVQPLRRRLTDTDGLDQLIDLLDWILRFPGVWALSEGNNPIDVRLLLRENSVLWLELAAPHLERTEQLIMGWMVEAAVVGAMTQSAAMEAAKLRPSSERRLPPLVLYAHPPTAPMPVSSTAMAAKHVGLFDFDARHPLPNAAQPWLDQSADCWVTGELGALPSHKQGGWLDEGEHSRLQALERGQVWVRAGLDRKAVTVLARVPETDDALAPALRLQAAKGRRLTPVKQMSSAATSDQPPAPAHQDLYERLCRTETLMTGWFRVKGHRADSHGNDGVTIRAFGDRLEHELAQLARELSQGSYRSRALRTVRIAKPDGDERILKVACVRDRVVQAACLNLLEPVFEPRFSSHSFAYRPGRSAHHALALARSAIRLGNCWAVTADIRKCFDTIDHDILLRLVGDVVADRELLLLLRQWLTADVIDFMDVLPSELGVPQGESISPLLANIYLDPLDKEFEREGTRFVRYADDYLVLCETEALALAQLRLMGEFLPGALRLSLKPAKTMHAHVSQGIAFLGFDIRPDDVRIPAERVDRAVAALAAQLASLTDPDMPDGDKWRAATRLNGFVRGFRNYFLIDDAAGVRSQLKKLDKALDEMVKEKVAPDSFAGTVLAARESFMPGAIETDSEESPRKQRPSGLAGLYAHESTRVGPPMDMVTETQPRSDGVNRGPPAQEASQVSTVGTQASLEPAVHFHLGRLHVMKSGCYVTVSGDDLVVRRGKREITRTPLAELSLLYLEGKGLALSADLTMQLCDRGVPVVFTPLIGKPMAIAQPIQGQRSGLRQQQVLRRNDPAMLKTGLRILAAKVANQASVLKYFARYRKRTDGPSFEALTHSADEVRAIAEVLEEVDPEIAGVRAIGMGHEGRAAAKYWAAFASLVPAIAAFPGRHTQNATDPVNSAINYVYSILYGEVWRAVVRAGLDPFFGIIHGTDRDQGSLVFDLIEEYRAAFADRVVLGLLGRGLELNLDQEGRLRTGCRQKLAVAFHKQWRQTLKWRGSVLTAADILESQVATLRTAYAGTEEYRPFRFRW